MSPLKKNPRKFRDKIALQNQLQDAKDKEFMAIMQEVSGVRKSSRSDMASDCTENSDAQEHSCCLHNKEYSVNSQSMGGPIRHRPLEQRASPYGRSRSLSPCSMRSVSPVILAQRIPSVTPSKHLEIPAYSPIQRQKSDPNLYLSNSNQSTCSVQFSPQDILVSPDTIQNIDFVNSLAVNSYTDRSGFSTDKKAFDKSSQHSQRRFTTGSIEAENIPPPKRKTSEPAPYIIVTQHESSEAELAPFEGILSEDNGAKEPETVVFGFDQAHCVPQFDTCYAQTGDSSSIYLAQNNLNPVGSSYDHAHNPSPPTVGCSNETGIPAFVHTLPVLGQDDYNNILLNSFQSFQIQDENKDFADNLNIDKFLESELEKLQTGSYSADAQIQFDS